MSTHAVPYRAQDIAIACRAASMASQLMSTPSVAARSAEPSTRPSAERAMESMRVTASTVSTVT